ncbi:MAG: glycosyltransferase [Nocardiopsaceae bacterium]|nr:glycosyltransferase [Nocardiopsaceae bacterium]
MPDTASQTPTISQTRHTVTAVVVAHDGARVLPQLFRALATQTHPVERLVGVDTGSRDHSESLLTELIGEDAVLATERGTGFGEAVAAALRHSAASRAVRTEPDIRRVEWIWLLHDDCEPAPDALERMIKAASRDRSVVILGPKVLDATDRRTLRETGIAIDRAGRRITGIEAGEIDQGQHDGTRPVLAVGSAGMLVRRDAWDRIGGFDASLTLFRDDLDFCWRAHGAGYRVEVVTDAVLYHHELSARRRRSSGGSPGDRGSSGDRGSPGDRDQARRLNRRNALYVLAVNLPLPQMLGVMAGCVAGSLLRAVWFLITKQKDMAATQAYAVAWLFLHPVRLWRARRRRAADRRAAYDAVRSFIPSGRTLPRIAEGIAGLVSSGPPPGAGGRHHAVSADEEEDEQFTDQPSLIRRIAGHPGVQLIVALTLVALVAERRLLGSSPLGGGALVPAWGGAPALWSEYLAGFHAVGLGSAASAPPYLAVVAALATVLGGQAWLAVDVLLLGCVPLAGITAYVAARRLVTATPARMLLAASYALLPVAVGAVAGGRLGTAVAFVMLPLIAMSAGRMLTAGPRAARRAAWATGLLVAFAAAFAPLVWPVAVVLIAVAVVVRRWLWPVSRIDAAIVAGAPLLLLFPWSLHLLGSPSALLAEVGIPVGNAGPSLSARSLLLLSPGGPGLPPAWVTAGLALGVVSAFLPAGRSAGRRLLTGTGWAVAAVGYLFAVIVSRTTIAAASGGPATGTGGGWPGIALAITALGVLLAAAPAAQWLCELRLSRRRSSERSSGMGKLSGLVRREVPVAVLAVSATAPVLAAGFWVADGVRGPVAPVTRPVLPAFVAAASAGPGQCRTLVLRPASGGSSSQGDGDGAVNFSVLRDGDPSLGQPELATYGPAGRALSRQVAALVAQDGADSGDPGQTLGSFGIRWVLLPGPVSQLLAQRLNAASGLVPLSSGSAYDLWQVAGTVAQARVIAPDGGVSAVASQPDSVSGATAPASGGRLVLAEPHGGWTATLNGTALKPLPKPVDGWEQGFALPKGGGTLAVYRDTLARTVCLVLELAMLVVIGVLAIPGKRDDPAEEAVAIAAVRAAQQERRVARAAKARELARAAAVRIMESEAAQRAVSRTVASFPPGSAPRTVGSRVLRVSGVPLAARAVRAVWSRRGGRVAAPAEPPMLALPPALPSAPSATPPATYVPPPAPSAFPPAPPVPPPAPSVASGPPPAPSVASGPPATPASSPGSPVADPLGLDSRARPVPDLPAPGQAVPPGPASPEPASPEPVPPKSEPLPPKSEPLPPEPVPPEPAPSVPAPAQSDTVRFSVQSASPPVGGRRERGAHRGGRHGKPRRRRKDRGGEW